MIVYWLAIRANAYCCWAMEEHLDVDPDAAGRVKSFLGIEPDYFLAIQLDPSDAEAERLIAELRSLTRMAGQG